MCVCREDECNGDVMGCVRGERAGEAKESGPHVLHQTNVSRVRGFPPVHPHKTGRKRQQEHWYAKYGRNHRGAWGSDGDGLKVWSIISQKVVGSYHDTRYVNAHRE